MHEIEDMLKKYDLQQKSSKQVTQGSVPARMAAKAIALSALNKVRVASLGVSPSVTSKTMLDTSDYVLILGKK